VMVWLGVCSKGMAPLVIFEQVTVNRARYIEDIFPIALKYDDKIDGVDWIF
jgi:hypothetical protein